MMDRQGVKPNVVTYSAIIAKLLEERNTDALLGAMDMLKWMEESGQAELVPTAVTYTNVLQAIHSWKGLSAEIVKECRAHVERQMRERRVEFNKVTYDILIKACMANGTTEGTLEGLRYFREMQTRQLSATADTWYLVLHGLAQQREWGIANELLDELEGSGMRNPKMRQTRWLSNLAGKIRRRENMTAVGSV